MAHCPECPIQAYKEAVEKGTSNLQQDWIMDGFMRAADQFVVRENGTPVQKDCSLGEKGCPAMFLKELKRREESD